MKTKKRFTHKSGNIMLNHEDPKLLPTVIATASIGWADIITNMLNRSDSVLKMVKGA